MGRLNSALRIVTPKADMAKLKAAAKKTGFSKLDTDGKALRLLAPFIDADNASEILKNLMSGQKEALVRQDQLCILIEI